MKTYLSTWMARIAGVVVWVAVLGTASVAAAANYTWTNTADGTTGYWTNSVNWGTNNYPGATANDKAYLTNATGAGTSYRCILDSSLANPLNTLSNYNSGGGQSWLIVTNATLVCTNLSVGNGSRLQIDNGGVVTNTTALTWRGTDGTIYLNSGGTLVEAADTTIFGAGISGVTATVTRVGTSGSAGTWDFIGKKLGVGGTTATGNVLRVDGGGVSGGVIVTNFNATSLMNGLGNSFILSNGVQAWVTGNPGGGGTSNTWKVVGGVSGVTTLVDLAGTAGQIGSLAGAVGNTLVVDGNGVYGGAVVTNGSQMYFGYRDGSNSNGLSIVNGGWFFAPATFGIGSMSGAGTNSGNFLNVGSAGMTSFMSMGGGQIGVSAESFGNTMTTTNAVIRGKLSVGSSGSSNTVTVLKDTAWDFAGKDLLFSDSSASTGNVVVINGGVVSNVSGVIFGKSAAGSFGSSLTVSNGGQLLVNGNVALANSTNSFNNVLTIASGGLLEVGGILSAGAFINANVITNFGGIYQFTNATPSITTNGVAGGSVFLNNGTISFRDVNGVNVKGNWAGTQLTKLTFVGTNNAFRLNNSTNLANVATNQTYTFDAIAGASTNYAGLEMVNGGTAYTNGSVTIGTNGWLTCSNTTAILWGAVTNYGRMAFYNNSTVTFTNGLVLNPSPKLQMIWASNSTVNVNGTLDLPASMVFSNTQPIAPGTTVALRLNASGGFGSSSPSGWTVYPNSHRITISGNSLVLTPRQPGFLIYVQ